MVKTMRKASKAHEPSTPNRLDSTRLSMPRYSTSGFSPVNKKSTDDGEDDDDGEESEDLPTPGQVPSQRKTCKADGAVAAQRSSSEGVIENEAKRANASKGEQGEDFQGLREALQPIEAYADDRDGSEEAENVDSHISSDIEDTTIGAQESKSKKRLIKGRGKRGKFWEDPQDTERLLELMEQFAMREHYVNTKKGGWRNNAFGEIGKHMGKDSKYCSNKYMRLKYKYLEIMELLNLGVGLKWDAENHKVSGHDTAWSKVKDPKLRKVKDRIFLYKVEFDTLNSALKFAPSLEVDKSGKVNPVVRKSSEVQKSNAESLNTAFKAHENDDEDHGDNEISKAGENEASDGDLEDARSDEETCKTPEAGPRQITLFTAGASSTSKRRSDQNWLDDASVQKLVHLLVEYVKDDYYISPVARTWKNGVFREIAGKIGKTQGLCQSKYMKLKDRYLDVEKLLGIDLGFEWDDKENEVVGSDQAWAEVKLKYPSLHCCRRWKFLFKKEFGKLAEKLNFDLRHYAPRTSRKRGRTSARMSAGSRPSYLGPPDEVDDDRHVNEERYARSDAGHESDEEPPRKKRFLSDTYKKRREAFYLATSNMSAKREELKAVVDAQLAIHRAQISALHCQLKTENQLSWSLQRCHIKDRQRRDDLESWRVLAQEKLQHEKFLTPRGQLRIMQTLPDLTSRTDGYLGVMFLGLTLRKLWCKMELEKEAHAQLTDYFIEDENAVHFKEEAVETYQDATDESRLVELESEEVVISVRGASESRDFNVEGSHTDGPDTSCMTADSTSHVQPCEDSDSSEKGDHVGDEEGESTAHVPDEKAINDAVSAQLGNQLDANHEDHGEEIEIDPYILIDYDQSGEARGDSNQEANASHDDEGLNQAFREIESNFVIDLGSDTTGEDPIFPEFSHEDEF